MGSLLTAVASFVHARQHSGDWLVRVDDIDPPRELAGAADSILASLDRLALHWNGPVIYQSRRAEAYRAAARRLLEAGLAFECSCTRRELRELGREARPYPGTCRTRRVHTRRTAVRVRCDPVETYFDDLLQGRVGPPPVHVQGDYVVYRRDGLPAYHLANVVDDAHFRITHVVRGGDLIDSTHVHRHLHEALDLPAPAYAHLPVLVDEQGVKLSKRTGAEPIDELPSATAAHRALSLLGANVPTALDGAPPSELWDWAVGSWRPESLSGRRKIRLRRV